MKFSICDLFLVTLIVALAVGWGVENRGRRMTQEGHKRLLLHAKEVKDELRFAKSEYDEVRDELAQQRVKDGIFLEKRTGVFRDVKWKLADEPLPP